MTYTQKGHLEQDYLSQDYLSGRINDPRGFQFLVEINDKTKASGFQTSATITKEKSEGFQFLSEIQNKRKSIGLQFESFINDKTSARAAQYEAQIVNSTKANGAQFEAAITTGHSSAMQFLSEILSKKQVRGLQALSQIAKQNGAGFQILVQIDTSKAEGLQSLVEILNQGSANGYQFESQIDTQKTKATQFRKDHYQSFPITGYLEDEYLSTPYLTGYFGPRIPFQFMVDVISQGKASGFQYHSEIIDKTKANGAQFEGIITKKHSNDLQFLSEIKNKHKTNALQYESQIIDKKKIAGEQFQAMILNKKHVSGIQFKVDITKDRPLATQFETQILDMLSSYGFQFEGHITQNSSRGMQYNAITTKSWAFQFLATVYNTKYLRILHLFKSRGLTNNNWTASSTGIGDYNVNNVDTDIVEQVWRSANGEKTNIKLTCDVGSGQVCYMDTLAILNHNLSAGATITMSMSNDPLFSTGVETIVVKTRRYDTYYIAPELPLFGYRFFRLEITDPTNSDDYLEIGCILFGVSDIIQGENFTDEVDFEMQDFSDTINTEGFTNVSNSRALKRKITLNFENWSYDKRNYEILRNVMQTYRTTHKCLWIPTPDVVNMDKTDRLRIFGKLTAMPKERHNNKGPGADYVSFTLELDESL